MPEEFLKPRKIVVVYYDMGILNLHFSDHKLIGEIIQKMVREAKLEGADEIKIVIK